jgi:hypothetical protein
VTAPRKAPCVDVRTDVHKDVRFEVLGELAGYNRYEALGRMHALWSWCVDRGLQDAPDGEDGFVVAEAVVRRFLGANGIVAILGDGIDDFALGERRDGARIYLRGTGEYVLDRRARVAVASAGGAARAAGGRDDAGRFVITPTIAQPSPQPIPSNTPAAGPAANQPTPASSSSPSSSTSDLGDTHTRVRERHPASGGIAERVWQHGARARADLKASNVAVPPWAIQHGADHAGWVALLDRVCEQLVNATAEDAESVCRNRVDVAAAKARKDGEGNWFAPAAMFSRNSFDNFAHLDPASFVRKQPQRASRAAGGAIGAATPRQNPEISMKPASEVL